MYDYEAAVREDVKQAIEDNYIEDEIIQHLAEDRDGWKDELYYDLWDDDNVTGIERGSYTNDAQEAAKNLFRNSDLLSEAMEAFGSSEADLSIGEELADVMIRCYLLGGAIDAVLDEYKEEYADEIAAYQGE